jgi:hypothetical protein
MVGGCQIHTSRHLSSLLARLLSRNKGLRSKASISSGFGAAQRKQGVVCRAAQITDPSPFLSHEGTTTQNAAEVSLRSKSLMVELEQNPYLPAWS